LISTQAGPPVFSFNLGECSYDDAGIDEVLRKMEADYNEAVFVRVVISLRAIERARLIFDVHTGVRLLLPEL